MRWLIALTGFGAVFAGLSLTGGAPAPGFHNVAASAGLVHSFPNGGDRSKQFIIETTGGGAAFLDYDNDGRPDIFLVSGPGGTNRLYHNEGNGRFVDVTGRMGLTQSGWGQGVCAADFDNDGYIDIFVTYWGANHLYRNLGGRRFEDVTRSAHLTQDRVRYNTGCAFVDYDNDGHIDLFVANYLRFDLETAPKPGENAYCWYRNLPVNCGPRGLPFDRNILYRSNGDGTFTDVSEPSGIATADQNYSLGVLTGDFNNDGRTDIYVACDRTPSLLYINQGGGKFVEEALLRGVALDDNGNALSGMGVTAADYDGDGSLDIFRTDFSDEYSILYRNRGRGEFDDATFAAGIARNTQFVGWGCGFFDYDNDGWKDLLLVNGHAFPEIDRIAPGYSLPAAVDPLPQSRRREVHRHFRFCRPGNSRVARGSRRGLQRLRQRRHGGSAHQQPERAAGAAQAARGYGQPLDHPQADGRPLQPQRDRRPGEAHRRRPHSNRRGAQRRKLSFSIRSAPALRPESGDPCG